MKKTEPGALDLTRLIDNRHLTHQAAQTAAASEEYARQAWEQDNNWALERLAVTVDAIGFMALVDKKREILHRATNQAEKGLRLRRLAWLPDDSVETRGSSRTSKIRAVCGHALLLSNRDEGVDGNFLEMNESYNDIFYALGIAIEQKNEAGGEQDNSLVFHRLFGQGQPGSDNLYTLLSGGHYKEALRHYNARYGEIFFGSDFLDHDRDESVIAAENTQYDAAHTAFVKDIFEAETKPVVSSRPEVTDLVHSLLLETPNPKRVAEGKKEERFGSQLGYLYDFGVDLDRAVLGQALDDFLRTSQTVHQWLDQ